MEPGYTLLHCAAQQRPNRRVHHILDQAGQVVWYNHGRPWTFDVASWTMGTCSMEQTSPSTTCEIEPAGKHRPDLNGAAGYPVENHEGNVTPHAHPVFEPGHRDGAQLSEQHRHQRGDVPGRRR